MKKSTSQLVRLGLALSLLSVFVLLSGCQSTKPKRWYEFWKRGADKSSDVEQYFPEYPDTEMPKPITLDDPSARTAPGGQFSVQEVSRPVAADEALAPAALQKIYFDFDSFEIRSDMMSAVEANARWLLDNAKGRQINVEGHCDERGSNEYNMSLSERRAAAVKAMLYKLGLDPNLMTVVPYGEERPEDPGQGEGAWAKNRRVQFLIAD